MTNRVRRTTLFAGLAALAFGFVWWALWYPWGQVPALPMYLYVPGLRECLPEPFPDSFLCTLTSTSFVNGQFRPSQTWLFALFLDPWAFDFRTLAYQCVLIGNWLLSGILFYYWLRLFQLPAYIRGVMTSLLLFSSSIVWYSAGSANIDPIALSLSLSVVAIWTLRLQRWWLLEMPITLLALTYIGGMSNTARLIALAVLAVTVFESRANSPRRWWIYTAYFCLAFTVAEQIEIHRREWGGDPIRSARFALALAGFAAMPFGAYLGAVFLPRRIRWLGLGVITLCLALTSPTYDFDFTKGDTLYLDQGRMWLIVLSLTYALARAMSMRKVMALGAFALANILLILFAELVTGKAQIDPNPRNFMVVQLFFAVAAPLWVRAEWARSSFSARASLAVSALAVVFHALALVTIHFESLRAAVFLEQAEARWVDFDYTCHSRSSRYSNIYLGRSVLLDAEQCRWEWMVAKNRPHEIVEFWGPIGPKSGYYNMTFGPTRAIPHASSLDVYAFPAEWPDLWRTLAPHRITYGVRSLGEHERPLSTRQGEQMLQQMLKIKDAL